MPDSLQLALTTKPCIHIHLREKNIICLVISFRILKLIFEWRIVIVSSHATELVVDILASDRYSNTAPDSDVSLQNILIVVRLNMNPNAQHTSWIALIML